MLAKSLYFGLLFLLAAGVSSTMAQTIHYLKKDATLSEIKEIKEQDWTPYEQPIYEGSNNGIYWFKIEMPRVNEPYVLSIPESHITRAFMYHQQETVPPLENSRYMSFPIKPNTQSTTYYLMVNCRLEARIPLSISKVTQHYTSEQYEFLTMGTYYGVVLCILLINFFSYISFRKKTYLYYMFMAIGMSINSVYKDGVFALLFGTIGINEYLEPTLNSILAISCIFCIESYLGINRYFPRLYRIGIGLVVLSQLLNIGVLLTQGDFWYYVTTDLVVLLALDTFWLSGLLLWRKTKSLESGLFSLAYGIPLFVAHGYYLSPYFGLHFLNVPFVWYKVGSVFEMAIFTYAITYQSKRLSLENQKMRQKIVDYTLQLKSQYGKLNEKETKIMELINLYGFTLKEIGILKDIAEERTNKEIAEKHYISQNTVKYHIKNIFDKLDVNNRKEAGNKLLGSSYDRIQIHKS